MKNIKVIISIIVMAVLGGIFFSSASFSSQADSTWTSGSLYIRENETMPSSCTRGGFEGLSGWSGSPADSYYTGCEIKGDRFNFLYETYTRIKDSADIYHGVAAVRDTKSAYGWKYRNIVLSENHRFWAVDGGNVLVETEYLVDEDRTKVYIYSDLDNALAPTMIKDGVYYEYTINRSAPGTKVYEVDHKVSSLRITPDAKYIFAKVYAPGQSFGEVVKIDTSYSIIEHITTEQYYDEVYAITNDGRYMLWGSTIYDTQQCVESASSQKICQSVDLRKVIRAHYGAIVADTYGSDIKFSEQGDSITLNSSVVMPNYTSMGQAKTLTISTYKMLDYLALGDSYSSGEGDSDKDLSGKKYYLPLTDIDKDTCHVSSRSYPFLLRDHMKLPSDSMQSVACSGAQVSMDYNRPLDGYIGQGGRLVGANDIKQVQMTALNKFIPGRIPQLEFVKKYKPKTITVTGGGNDVGFADILAYCATPTWENAVFWVDSDCGYANKGSDLERMLNNAINTQYYSNMRLIEDLKSASSGTRIIIVGYPSFVTDESATGCALNSGTLTKSEITMINKAVNSMNQMLQRVAFDTNVSFVNIEDSLKGGRICEGGQYMTGVWSNVTGDASPSERFHPNAKGHQKIAETIIESRVLQQNKVPGKGLFNVISNYAKSIRTKLLDSDLVTNSDNTKLQVAEGFLAPNSQYTPTIYSTPMNLGTYSSDDRGVASHTLSLKSIPPGKHILMLRGNAPTGETVELYQFITINPTENRIEKPQNVSVSSSITKVSRDSSSETSLHVPISTYSGINNLGSSKTLNQQSADNVNSNTEGRSKSETTQTSTIYWVVMLVVAGCIIILGTMKMWVHMKKDRK